jgi:hypothetical protein
MSDVNDSIKAALEAAASETEESSKEVSESEEEQETETEKTEEKVSSVTKGKNAQGRIRELVDRSKELQEQLDALGGTVTERDAEIEKLVDLLSLRENDTKIVQRINELHADPRFKPDIEKLDHLLRTGELPETEEIKGGEKESSESKALRLLEQTRESLEERIADQEAEIILGKADILADRYIDELPDEYNDDDKRLLREILTDRIDWEKVEADPDMLAEAFAEGFQATLDHYGTPKGFVPAPKEDEEEPEKKEVTIESLLEKDWGKLKDVTTPDGKTIRVPAVSDAQFTNVLAEALRRSRS